MSLAIRPVTTAADRLPITPPANYDPQRYQPHQVQIQGKLAGLLRRYH